MAWKATWIDPSQSSLRSATLFQNTPSLWPGRSSLLFLGRSSSLWKSQPLSQLCEVFLGSLRKGLAFPPLNAYCLFKLLLVANLGHIQQPKEMCNESVRTRDPASVINS